MCQPIQELITNDQQHAFSECVLRLQEKQLKKMETEKAMMLEVPRERKEAIAELAKLKEKGIVSSEQTRD